MGGALHPLPGIYSACKAAGHRVRGEKESRGSLGGRQRQYLFSLLQICIHEQWGQGEASDFCLFVLRRVNYALRK